MANNSLNDIEDGGTSLGVILLLPAIPIVIGVAWFVCYRYKIKINRQLEELRKKGDELWLISIKVNKKLRGEFENLSKQLKDLLDKISSDGWVDKDDKANYRILEAKVNNILLQNEGV